MQNTSIVFMIRPVSFKRNEQTAVNNYYQQATESSTDTTKEAVAEFDALVGLLREHGIIVHILQDRSEGETPDSLFPNNWISTHSPGKAVLYPMFAPNRRKERRSDDIVKLIGGSMNTKDMSHHENDGKFLEGTGSLVLDRVRKIAYACISARTDETLVMEWAGQMKYTPVIFHGYHTVNGSREPIYHTNVMMCIGSEFVVICDKCIDDLAEREKVFASLTNSGLEVILISEEQVASFAGNMLELRNENGEVFIVMSTAAYHSLEVAQVKHLEKFGKILHSPLPVIERNGGGSARCMIAEIFV